MDVTGSATILSGGDPTFSVGGFPSFRCPASGATCVLAEGDESQVTFTAFDPGQGRSGELLKLPADPDFTAWDLSRDGKRIAVSTFDHKAGDAKVISLADKSTTRLSAMPWTQLSAIAWSADGKRLYFTSASSRGTTIVAMELGGKPAPLFKQPSWDIFSLMPSPDGRYLAFGPLTTNANAWTIANFPGK